MTFTKRTHTVADLQIGAEETPVVLNGWVHRLRIQKNTIFLNLRDRSGIAQCLIDETTQPALYQQAKDLHLEFCVALTGLVRPRPAEMINPAMSAGHLELVVTAIEVLNACETPPFTIEEGATKAKEESRLKYRYLDLRSGRMQHNIKLRHEVSLAVRQFLADEGFYEVETPIFMKSTPEGARDYVVPSRLYPGEFFALPQSPQLYKQVLMASGMEKYFQIARCFRDEDPRGDRQPEFTQIDIEMSFVTQDDVLSLTERLFGHLFSQVMNLSLPAQFRRLSYHDALNTYGSDKPDLRFDLMLIDFTAQALASSATFLHTAANHPDQSVKALLIPGFAAQLSRKMATDLERIAKQHGLGGLMWLKQTEAGLEGPGAKFFADSPEVLAAAGLTLDGALLVGAGEWETTCTAMGAIRNFLGTHLNLIDTTRFEFCWIVDFPLFAFNSDLQKWEAAHHMFTMPQAQFIDTLESNPKAVLGNLYDLVLNGYELASGSIRIHESELQKRVFRLIGYPDDVAQERFGFLLEAFKFGCPPHGGIAPGLDRLIMLLCGEENIREVIAFPKNTSGVAVMENAPSPIEDTQLTELHISINKPS